MTAAITRFLNVDLDLKSRRDLAPLVAKLGKVVVIHSRTERGYYRVSLELYEQRYDRPETCIARFVRLVEALPSSARRLWDGASEKRFDVGVQAGSKGMAFKALITARTLGRVSELGGDVAITVYPPRKPSRRKRPRQP